MSVAFGRALTIFTDRVTTIDAWASNTTACLIGDSAHRTLSVITIGTLETASSGETDTRGIGNVGGALSIVGAARGDNLSSASSTIKNGCAQAGVTASAIRVADGLSIFDVGGALVGIRAHSARIGGFGVNVTSGCHGQTRLTRRRGRHVVRITKDISVIGSSTRSSRTSRTGRASWTSWASWATLSDS